MVGKQIRSTFAISLLYVDLLIRSPFYGVWQGKREKVRNQNDFSTLRDMFAAEVATL